MATQQFLMAYLSNIELQNWGYISGFLNRPVDSTKLVLDASVWMDQNRQYLIFTGVSMKKGPPYTHMWCKKEYPDPNEEPNMVDLTISNPITSEIYYSACVKIDRHNRCRQESLDVEKKLVTKDWLKRFKLFIFVIYAFYVWLAYQWITRKEDAQADF